jgi:hypothetical protein
MKIKNLILGIAIMVLASFVAIYGIKTFYGDSPMYDDFCKNVVYPAYEINTSGQCDSLGGKWINFGNSEKFDPVTGRNSANGYCDLYAECSQEFNNASEKYSRNLFFIVIPVAVVMIAIGAVLFALEAVGAGIMAGGIITLIYGASSYWPRAGNMFRFVISLVGLVVVIFVGYWINKELAGIKKELKEDIKSSKIYKTHKQK